MTLEETIVNNELPIRRDSDRLVGIPAELTDGLSAADAKRVCQVTSEIQEYRHKIGIDFILFTGENNGEVHKIYSKRGPKSKYGEWLKLNRIHPKFDERCRDVYKAFGDVENKLVLTRFSMEALYYLAKPARSLLRGEVLKLVEKNPKIWINDKLVKDFAASMVGNTLRLISTAARENPNPKKLRLTPFKEPLDTEDKDAGEVIVRCSAEDREHATRQAIARLQAYLDANYPKSGFQFGSSDAAGS